VRVVRTPGGDVILDPTGRAAGRGAYVCATGTCSAEAVRRRAIEHALGVPLTETLRERLAAGSLD
jgi:predicted RNA-binding protein YlxR (DUF448 family)